VHAVEEAHEEHLRISLSSVSRSRALGGLSDLDDDLLVHRQYEYEGEDGERCTM
jgi:hypothetical protein